MAPRISAYSLLCSSSVSAKHACVYAVSACAAALRLGPRLQLNIGVQAEEGRALQGAHLQVSYDLRILPLVVTKPVVGVLALVAVGADERLWPLDSLGRLFCKGPCQHTRTIDSSAQCTITRKNILV
jgi:hypothetical protein